MLPENQALLSLLAIVVSLLVTSGAVAFVFRYGIRLAVLERVVADKDQDIEEVEQKQTKIDSRLQIVEDAVKALNKVADELGRLPGIEAKMEQIVKLLQEQVPRNEVDVRFSDMARRISALEVEQRTP